MTAAVKFIIDCFWDMFSVIDEKLQFYFFGYDISFMDILISFIVLGFIVSVFWRGVKA